MGSSIQCSVQRRPKKSNTHKIIAQKYLGKFDQFELEMLILIYKDLSSRSQNNHLSRDSFNCYFKIIGLWGEQIFNRFAHKNEDYMSFEEFLVGLEMYIKCSEERKIYNLFQLYDLHNQNGILKSDFLQMLHNYPKEELKKILDDQLFLEDQQIISAYDRQKKKRFKPRKDSSDLLEISLNQFRKQSQNLSEQQYESSNKISEDINSKQSEANLFPQDSMVQRNGVPLKGFGVNLTFFVMMFLIQVNGQKMEMHANLNLLIRKYVDMVYKLKQDQLLQLQDFKLFVQKHPNLITPLYSTFNYNIWGINNQEPNYKTLYFSYQQGLLIKMGNCLEMVKRIKQRPGTANSILILCLNFTKRVKLCLQRLYVCLDQQLRSELICKLKNMVLKYFILVNNTKANCIIAQTRNHIKIGTMHSKCISGMKLEYLSAEINKHYSIMEKIGEGKYSTVYKCQQKQTKQDYALKIINKLNLSPNEEETVKHEVDIMKLMNHSCIVKLNETFENRTHIYMVTELVTDGDLFDYVQNKKYLDEVETAMILTQLIDALMYIHSIGIVHRDMKPENIMIILNQNAVKSVKIIDFGFSNYLSIIKQRKMEDFQCGTFNYLAPEALQYQEITTKVDNFALGAILYFMLSGYLPFDSDIPQEIIQNTIDGVYDIEDEFWQCVSDDAKDLVVGLLLKDPKQRFTLEQAKEHKWLKRMLDSRKSKKQ